MLKLLNAAGVEDRYLFPLSLSVGVDLFKELSNKYDFSNQLVDDVEFYRVLEGMAKLNNRDVSFSVSYLLKKSMIDMHDSSLRKDFIYGLEICL